MLLLLVLCAVSLPYQLLAWENCYCVGSEEGPNPCSAYDNNASECRPLDYYVVEQNVTSDSLFCFKSEVHVLEGAFKVRYVNDLSLIACGNGSNRTSQVAPTAVVQCAGDEGGIYFTYIKNLSIIGLRFDNCGKCESGNYSNALALKWVSNLYMCGVSISNSSGTGIFAYEIGGNSTITHTTVEYTNYAMGEYGGNLQIIYDTKYHPLPVHTTTNMLVSHSQFRYADNKDRGHYASGVSVLVESNCSISITFRNVSMLGNVGSKSGGNMAITVIRHANDWPNLTVDNCTLAGGRAKTGGGLYISLRSIVPDHNPNKLGDRLVVNISDTIIRDNFSNKVGAGAYIQLHEDCKVSVLAEIRMTNCTFQSNTIHFPAYGRGGVALNMINFRIPGYVTHQIPQYNVLFVSCNFTQSHVQVSSVDSVGSAAFYVEEMSLTTLTDCLFADNNCTGITAVHSNLVLNGNISINNNTGLNGGGMVMCSNSVMFLSPNVSVVIQDNSAYFGGGIYAEYECSQAIPSCFFQLDEYEMENEDALEPAVHLVNNTALAGSAVYGGSIDYCYFFVFKYAPRDTLQNSSFYFQRLFKITSKPPNTPSISSDALRVCFCKCSESHCTPNCMQRTVDRELYSGATLSVAAVLVGQKNGPVPGVVEATTSGSQAWLGKLQSTQNFNNTFCKYLYYTVYSNISSAHNETIKLRVENNFRDLVIDPVSVKISVKMLPCPTGFRLWDGECICIRALPPKDTCNISTTSIYQKRTSNSSIWIGFKNISDNTAPIMYCSHCPLDYCVPHDVQINTTSPNSQDVQCAFDRTGTICGRCKHGLSNMLGSSRCAECTHNSTIRAVGLTVAFALAGVLLIFLLGLLDLNVSEGTLNAILFYMNIIIFNSSIFLAPPSSDRPTASRLLSIFVAWMNLDFGIELCFFNGMTAMHEAWLQFVFPLYLWLLAGLIIFFSRRSSLVARIFGKNAVKLLATIVLHSYGKLLRAILDAVMPSPIITRKYDSDFNSPESGTLSNVWALDGNLSYFGGHHICLFVFAIIVAAFTFPYMLVLLFIQCLRKKSHLKLLFWVEYLKPFFDAYTAPYKNSFHFWTGFLLLIRMLLFMVSIVNTKEGPILNITVIIATTSLLIVLLHSGIYRRRWLGVLESCVYLNLIVFCCGIAYVITWNYSKHTTINICLGSIFIMFVGIVVYHIFLKISHTQKWRQLKVWLLDKKWPWMKRKPIRSLIISNIVDSDEISSSEDELDPILKNAPPVVRYDQYREPLIETEENV